MTVAGLAAAFGSGAMTNSIDELEFTDLILATGSNTTENHPIIGMKIKRAVRQQGAKLIVIDPREIGLVKYAEIWLRQKPGTDVAVFNGLMNIIINENIYAREYVDERTEKDSRSLKLPRENTLRTTSKKYPAFRLKICRRLRVCMPRRKRPALFTQWA